MNEFLIDFNNGSVFPVVAKDLSDVKKKVLSLISTTGTDITILDHNGDELTEAIWFNWAPDEDDFVLRSFPDGFYQLWTDEFRGLVTTYRPLLN